MSTYCPTGFRDAATLVRAYAEGVLTPSAALETRFCRIERTPHVMLRVTSSRARAEAQASEERRRTGAFLGPLDGVPFVWKDLFDGTPRNAFFAGPPGCPAALPQERPLL